MVNEFCESLAAVVSPTVMVEMFCGSFVGGGGDGDGGNVLRKLIGNGGDGDGGNVLRKFHR